MKIPKILTLPKFVSGHVSLSGLATAVGHLGAGRLGDSLIKIDILQVEAGILKNHSVTELKADVYMFEKCASWSEIEAGFMQGIISKCIL